MGKFETDKNRILKLQSLNDKSPVHLDLENDLILSLYFFQKCKLGFRNTQEKLEKFCFSLHIFCKKLEYKIKPSKDGIRSPLVVFSAFLKKITTTKSSANFLSPDSNGQG